MAGTGTTELDFGSDTLYLIRFINLLEKEKADLNKLFATIVGRNIRTKVEYDKKSPLTKRVCKSILNGYIRSLVINDNGKMLEVGGSNATKEHIAAKKISITIPPDYFYKYNIPHYLLYYDLDSKIKANPNELEEMFKNGQIDGAIALARRKQNELSYKVLSDYLEKPLNEYRMEFVCEGFRSLERLYEKEKGIAISAFKNLRAFIEKFVNTEKYSKSIVYAIESVGYILKNNKGTTGNEIFEYLSDLLEDFEYSSNKNHDHYLWSLVCSISNHSRCKEKASGYIIMLKSSIPEEELNIDYFKIPLNILEELVKK